MPEPATTNPAVTSSTQDANAIDLGNYVSKEDHSKELDAKEGQIASLKADLDKAKMSLLDPGYLEYLEAKAKDDSKPETKASTGTTAANKGGISNEELAARFDKSVSAVNAKVNELMARNELEAIKARYTDFDDYREDIQKILENSANDLTYEQAYAVAKQHAIESGDGAGKEGNPVPLKGSEKPTGTVPAKTMEKKEYATEEEASDAAWEAVKDKYPDLGDTL